VGVRRDQDARRAAGRQIGFEARRVDRVVVDQQQPIALVPQTLAHFFERWFPAKSASDRVSRSTL
jgi:hypothetical protein